jgi:hypothetical protein
MISHSQSGQPIEAARYQLQRLQLHGRTQLQDPVYYRALKFIDLCTTLCAAFHLIWTASFQEPPSVGRGFPLQSWFPALSKQHYYTQCRGGGAPSFMLLTFPLCPTLQDFTTTRAARDGSCVVFCSPGGVGGGRTTFNASGTDRGFTILFKLLMLSPRNPLNQTSSRRRVQANSLTAAYAACSTSRTSNLVQLHVAATTFQEVH